MSAFTDNLFIIFGGLISLTDCYNIHVVREVPGDCEPYVVACLAYA